MMYRCLLLAVRLTLAVVFRDRQPVIRHPGFQLFACMNPATDVGKKDLTAGVRSRFTEFYVNELTSRQDLRYNHLQPPATTCNHPTLHVDSCCLLADFVW